jgi:pyruvate kinase
VGHILVKGASINDKSASAPLCVCETEEELKKNYKEGDIIVIKETSNNIMEQLKNASAIVCEKDGKNSHAAIVGLSLDIPTLVGVKNATQILKSGAIVTVDGKEGVVVSN